MASRQKAKQKFPNFIKIRQWVNSLKTYLVTLFVVSTSVLKRLLRTISNYKNLLLVLLLLLLQHFRQL
ncbi:MAG: hypothetical protein V7L27_26130 [Nostoc sp.]|uniref:hypothetical protein n=1 Tax=Nostoc sp. TaxID=1180 RepID=UPI002FF70247